MTTNSRNLWSGDLEWPRKTLFCNLGSLNFIYNFPMFENDWILTPYDPKCPKVTSAPILDFLTNVQEFSHKFCIKAFAKVLCVPKKVVSKKFSVQLFIKSKIQLRWCFWLFLDYSSIYLSTVRNCQLNASKNWPKAEKIWKIKQIPRSLEINLQVNFRNQGRNRSVWVTSNNFSP